MVDLKEQKWYTKSEEEALYRTGFGREYGPGVKTTTKWKKEGITLTLS